MALAATELSRQRACELIGLSRSRFYELSAPPPPSAARVEAVCIRGRVEELCLEFSRYGYRRITAQLRREGMRVNHKRVQRIMQEEGLCAAIKRRFINTTDSTHGYRRFPNLLVNGSEEKAAEGDDLEENASGGEASGGEASEAPLSGLDRVWVADFTYIRLRETFLYLAVVMDCCSRRVLGWDLSSRPTAAMCLRALGMALTTRSPQAGFIHHSDQGVQYASTEYVALLEESGARISMSRRGNPYDNARMESFIKTLKQEEVHLVDYRDEAHARSRLEHFLTAVYNQKRLHSSLGYCPPEEFELLQRSQNH